MSKHRSNRKFLRLYEEIRKAINGLAGREKSNRLELDHAVAKHGRLKKIRKDIESIGAMRNVLAHPHAKSAPFEVSPHFLDHCKSIRDEALKSRTAGQLGVERKKLMTASWGCGVHDVVAKMRRKRFSHIPVLDGEDRVAGVFNESAMFEYLSASGMAVIIEPDETLEALRQCCRIGADHIETFRFVKPGRSEDDLVDMFVRLEGKFTRLGAVFVTDSGKRNGPVRRMVTAWDVLSRKSSG